MGYFLGIDLGTTYTAAAVWRDGRLEVSGLGTRAPVVPSVVFLKDDETVLTGEAAERRGVTEPSRVAREFKRRLGDTTPLVLGGTPLSADALTAKLLRWVVDQVTAREGGPPEAIAVSHPANWGAFKTDLLRQAFHRADLDDAVMLTEPEAAALHYASQSRVEAGTVVAVYDLGGGTFDAAVLRKTDGGFQVLGQPQGIERLGGIDFDEAVFQHVAGIVGEHLAALDLADPTALAAVARLREECVEAKEALSADTDVSIPVLLPTVQTEVRLTRAEFEAMIRPALADSITALERALRSAAVAADEVDVVLLVGGSSRIPLVAQLVGSAIGRPVAVDAHPKHGIALGAALAAARAADALEGGPPTEPHEVVDTGPVAVVPPPPADPPPPPPAPSVGDHEPTAPLGVVGGPPSGWEPAAGEPTAPVPVTASAPRPRVPVGALAAVVVILLVVVGIAVVLSGGGDDEVATAGEPSTTTAPPDTAPATTVPPAATTPSTATTTAPTTTTTAAPDGPFVRLDDVRVEGGRYRVDYTVSGFVPQIDGGPDSLHLHIFLNTTRPEDAGTNGNPPGVWQITDAPTGLLTDFTVDGRGGATELCGVVATVDHAVFDPGSGTCLPLPG